MPYDLSACGLVTVSTSRFVACALGSHIFGNPNVSNDGTVIIGTVVNGTALSLTDGNAAHTYFKFNTTCGSIIESDSRLTFITSGAPNALVLTGGNVGIGTASPTAKLHVNGSSQFDDTLNFASRGKLSWGGSPARLILTSCGSYNLALGTDDFVDRMTIQCGTGNVGIGTNSPTSPLHLRDSTNGFAGLRIEGSGTYAGSDFTIFASALSPSSADDFLGFYNNSTTDGATSEYKFRLFKSGVANFVGNVGIGTDSPVANDGTSKTLQVGSRLSIQNVIGTQFLLGTNTYYDGTWKYIACAKAQAVRGTGESGTINFVLSPQGTAGCTVTNMDCSDIKMIILESGNTGIGITSPTYRLHVNGTFYAAGSSQDYKQSICNYNTDSCMFMKLKPVTYQYKEEYCHLGKELKSGTQIGLIAEEVAESHPELAILVNEEENKVVRNVDYEKLTIILLSELQKLRQEVDQLKNK